MALISKGMICTGWIYPDTANLYLKKINIGQSKELFYHLC
jgi:hypothetical protein